MTVLPLVVCFVYQGAFNSEHLKILEGEFQMWHRRRFTLASAPTRSGRHLAIYAVSSGLPDDLELVLEVAGTPRPIFSLADLQGQMNIRSCQDALNFTWLESSLLGATAVLPWKSDMAMDVLAPSEYRAKRKIAYSDEEPDWSGERLDGFAGIVWTKGLQDEIRGYPSVHPEGGGFLVSRLLVVGRNPESMAVEKVIQRVGRDGAYRLVSEETIQKGPLLKVAWFFPLRK